VKTRLIVTGILAICITTIIIKCDRILEHLPFWHKQALAKTQLKIDAMILKLSCFAHFDKAAIKAANCEISHQKLLFPRRY